MSRAVNNWLKLNIDYALIFRRRRIYRVLITRSKFVYNDSQFLKFYFDTELLNIFVQVVKWKCEKCYQSIIYRTKSYSVTMFLWIKYRLDNDLYFTNDKVLRQRTKHFVIKLPSLTVLEYNFLQFLTKTISVIIFKNGLELASYTYQSNKAFSSDDTLCYSTWEICQTVCLPMNKIWQLYSHEYFLGDRYYFFYCALKYIHSR